MIQDLDGGKDKMVKVTSGGQCFYLDGYLKANTDAMIRDVTKKNYDGFVLVVGREGFGKSTIALQLAKYCDPNFGLDNVCFTAEQFLYAVEHAEKYQAILFDETMGYLSSRSAMSKFNKVLIKVMSEMRSKNLFVFLCIPNIFMMDWYVAQHRTTGMIYIRKRGTFGSYDYPTKKKLYIEGKRKHSYHVPPNFIGMFVKYFTVDKEEYEKKKQIAINQWAIENKLENKYKIQRDRLIRELAEKNLMKKPEIAEILGLSLRQIQELTQ
jgi:energy-coupling factor transporter ATP-binding protein EcfA2